MEVVSACSLPVGSIVWQTRSGGASLTVVCKATYALAPVESRLADEQDPLHEGDHFWGDDPRQALRLASDFAPFKRRADVLLTGHAYAPRGEPARSIVARLLVGEVDKAIEIFADRAFTAEGELREGQRFKRSPILWQHAAGGPDTMNPVGLRRDAPPDIYGQRALPRLQPAGLHVTGPDDYIPPVGFGPIAPTWPDRRARLFHHAATWDHLRWHERPLPDDIDVAYFNAALADQQVEALRPDERLVLENLDPEHPRLVTNLAPATPRATVEWANRGEEDVRLRCDTLWIDTDRRRCSLTWRAAIPLLRGELPARVTVHLSGAVLGGLRLGARGVEITPLPTREADLAGSPLHARAEARAASPVDLDADTVDSIEYIVADEETQDRLTLPPSLGRVMPFAPPAPPPMLGPLATPEMLAAPEPTAPAAPAAPAPPAAPAASAALAAAPAPALEDAAPALPLDRFPLAACARIAASIARRRPEAAAILAEHELASGVWPLLEKHWAAALAEEAQRGKSALLRAYDEAYVARLEEERGAITPREYARLIIAVERGRADVVLGELSLPRGAILRIQRVWLNRFAADAAFNKSVRAAMAAETEGEE
jgi:hypothetical protein